jgi:hypothetical protein
MNSRRKWNLGELNTLDRNDLVEKSTIQPIKLVLNPVEFHSFYQFHFHEKTWINGNLHRNEIKKLIHLKTSKINTDQFLLHAETFDRLHLNRNLSISEKEFIREILTITEDLQLITDQYAQEYKIKNHPIIQAKANRILEKLSKNYRGKSVQQELSFLKSFYENPNKIIQDQLKYKNLGLLLPKFYRYYDSHQSIYIETKHRFMDNIWTSIEEFIHPIKESNNIIEFEVIGKLKENHQNQAFAFLAKNKNVYLEGNEIAKLELYKGKFILDKPTGLVQNSSIEIKFSFGENYQKSFEYQLNAVTLEEI